MFKSKNFPEQKTRSLQERTTLLCDSQTSQDLKLLKLKLNFQVFSDLNKNSDPPQAPKTVDHVTHRAVKGIEIDNL